MPLAMQFQILNQTNQVDLHDQRHVMPLWGDEAASAATLKMTSGMSVIKPADLYDIILILHILQHHSAAQSSCNFLCYFNGSSDNYFLYKLQVTRRERGKVPASCRKTVGIPPRQKTTHRSRWSWSPVRAPPESRSGQTSSCRRSV